MMKKRGNPQNVPNLTDVTHFAFAHLINAAQEFYQEQNGFIECYLF